MKVKELITPLGNVKMLKNGSEIIFDVKEKEAEFYGLNAQGMETKMYPEAFYEIWVNIADLEVGDEIICYLEDGDLTIGNGSEHMYNLIGEDDTYKLGIGAFNTDELNRKWLENPDEFEDNLFKTDYFVPYSNIELIEDDEGKKQGYAFIMMDKAEDYNGMDIRQNIVLRIAWDFKQLHHSNSLINFLSAME